MRKISIFILIFLSLGMFLQAQPVTHGYHNQIYRIEILPSGTVTMAANTSLRFTVVAYNRENMAFTPSFVMWETTGGNIASDGTYTSSSFMGTFQVTARCNNVRSNSVSVIVRGHSSNISRVIVNPENVSLSTNGTMQFRATAYDIRNRPVSGTFFWSADGGTIDQNGYFRAGYSSGTYTITARESTSGAQGQATIHITGGYNPQPYPQPPYPQPPYPQPPYPQPYPNNARIVITNFDVGGNFMKPDIKVTAQVFGRRIQTIRLFAVKKYGTEEIVARSCKDNETVFLKGKFDRFGTEYIEIKLYDNLGSEVARETRKP